MLCSRDEKENQVHLNQLLHHGLSACLSRHFFPFDFLTDFREDFD